MTDSNRTKRLATRNRALAAIAIAAATVSLPALSNAQSYRGDSYAFTDCKRSDKKNQLAGGVIGAIAGGVIGSQVSGNGARTEGSVIGAVLGGAAGAGIGDDMRNCRRETGTTAYSGSTYRSGTTYQPSSYTTTTYPTTPSYPTTTYSSTRSYPTTTTYPTTASQPYRTVYTSPNVVSTPTYTSTSTTYSSQPSYVSPVYQPSHQVSHGRRGGSTNRIDRIEHKISILRAEREAIKRRSYGHHDRYAQRRIEEISSEMRRLKDKKKRLKKRNRRSQTHYHGNQICHNGH